MSRSCGAGTATRTQCFGGAPRKLVTIPRLRLVCQPPSGATAGADEEDDEYDEDKEHSGRDAAATGAPTREEDDEDDEEDEEEGSDEDGERRGSHRRRDSASTVAATPQPQAPRVRAYYILALLVTLPQQVMSTIAHYHPPSTATAALVTFPLATDIRKSKEGL